MYIQKKMPRWLAYIRAQPSLAILSSAITEYINSHPKVSAKNVSKDNFFKTFFFDEKFIAQLNEEGKKIASKVTLKDIMEELAPYAQNFPEVQWVFNIITNNYSWCNKNLKVLKKQHLQIY